MTSYCKTWVNSRKLEFEKNYSKGEAATIETADLSPQAQGILGRIQGFLFVKDQSQNCNTGIRLSLIWPNDENT